MIATRRLIPVGIASALVLALGLRSHASPPSPSTFSIVAADPEAGEVGVAVASRFFAVGTVVPWAKAGVGAVATQANANTSYGPRGLELLKRPDDGRDSRQLGVVSASGASAKYTGPKCNAWAGGRHGPNYAVQGNILTGEPVVEAMEKAFLDSKGKLLAERLYAAIVAGDAKGGDSRGRQSMALVVARAKSGYNGFTDRAIDLRVDDHPDPIVEMGRILGMALVNYHWIQGWTASTEKRFPDALRFQEMAAAGAEKQPGMLPEVLYDLSVIRLANGDRDGSWKALQRAL